MEATIDTAEEGVLRRMTLGEIAMARRIYGDSIVL